jgi:lantibiotic modifying enzyme
MDLTASTDQIATGVEARIRRQVEACADVLLDLAIRDRSPAGFADQAAMWCHGAAGIWAVRLRLLQLQRAGVDLPIPAATLQAEAEAALHACARALTEAVQRGHQYGPDGIGHRLTLCHGLRSAIDLLLLAHEVLGSPEHLAGAQLFSDQLLGVLGDDPLLWPAGVGTGASTGLFVGLAGTAFVLARAGYPEHRIAAPSLLPVSDLLPVG